MEVLRLAAQNDVVSLNRTLRQGTFDPNTFDSAGWSPMHLAAWYGNAKCLTALCLLGGQPNSRHPITRDTPLHFAAARGNYECVRELLARGADPNARNRAGDTPGHLALGLRDLRPVRCLLLFGLKPQAQNNNGDSLIAVAKRKGNMAAVELLTDPPLPTLKVLCARWLLACAEELPLSEVPEEVIHFLEIF
eukprot:comp18227_c0_seq1/m.19168 comp18227_c0_seq1/g.19168  ORF comp18227_c0_seq1/g.19168 comp18227_c0_seq1/m.19168 type:complete len:192 (-) comp18227_c0_seq1:592-1167(-)